jgi:hypothetical protein
MPRRVEFQQDNLRLADGKQIAMCSSVFLLAYNVSAVFVTSDILE